MQEHLSGVIFAAEDNQINIILLKTIFKKFPDVQLIVAQDGEEAIEMLENLQPDLILLDIMMPRRDGYEVARYAKANPQLAHIPIIFLTALADETFKLKAFESGGIDYVTKPINKNELIARVNAHLNMKKMADELKVKNELLQDRELHLSELVNEKTHEIEEVTFAMISALEDANSFNDSDTGNHIRRVSEFSAILAVEYGCNAEFIRKVKLYASLHDVGKVGIPDSVLKKPGKLNGEEWELMKQHVVIGHKMLNHPVFDEMARNISLYHHERWDGKGYVHGLAGEDIPLEARIVMLADIFDALTQKRVYKTAFSLDKADKIIRNDSGIFFDPKLVEIYFNARDKFIEIKERLQ